MTPKKETGTESKVALIKAEINKQLGDAETLKSLLEVTFPGFEAPLMKRALLEGMMRGFPFEAFLKKDVYAIKYGNTYSLVTSIDYSRKIGAKSGIVGVDAPIYKEEEGRVVSCAVTVKKMIGTHIGDFTAEVYMSEYSTGKNLWTTKPRTMIAKVAEMHALRKACPEELAQAYVEEEVQPETVPFKDITPTDYSEQEVLLRKATSLDGLNYTWADLPGDAKVALKGIYEEMKAMITTEEKVID